MRRFVIALAILTVATACSTDEPTGETTVAPQETTTSAAPSESANTLSVGASSLGEILVDADGRTLYLFVPDAQGDSTCYDECEATWPPLVGEGQEGDGIDDSLMGTAPRTDGSVQVTYDGWPLYYFAGDAAPGDTNGQGLNEIWYVVSPDGVAIGMETSQDDASSSIEY
ncbi:MAG TPA: hypothetical protein VLA29_04780 [Acidimicrobiia bacterium]|nr:hypothetical protein [Acidimicrobiia bacterium]